MKNYIYLFFLFFLILSCTTNKPPVFLKVDAIKVVQVKSDTIRLKAKAFFTNPNDVGGKISTDEIKVFINGAEVAQVSSDEFKVPARKEFTIPLKVVIPTRKIYENNKNGILGGLINSFLKRSVEVKFTGTLQYKFWGFKKDFIVNQVEEIKL